MPQLHTILPNLIGDFCSQWRPRLFPFHEGSSWLHTERYESPKIASLKLEVTGVRQDADAHVGKLQEQIEEIRDRDKDMYTLLSGTGNDLVQAVIRSLKKLSFKNVIDVDKQAEDNGQSLLEDIQIHDQSPILIVDVKGVTGCPEDGDATQSEKHALIRSRESEDSVQPLTIINHERNIPPHDRNPTPYRQEIVGNAMQTKLGLMTSWDVFRLLRNKETLDWPDGAVRQVFYRIGRIEPIPDHYIEVGCIVRTWKQAKAFGIIPTKAISVHSRLAIEVGDLFEEIQVESLQVDDKISRGGVGPEQMRRRPRRLD